MKVAENQITQYIDGFPHEVQILLQQVRNTIKNAALGAEEVIKYAIPTYVLNGSNLVHFAGYKNHIGFYSVPTGIEAFKQELSIYKSAKGSVQFPLDQPIPFGLIEKIVQYRINESKEKVRGLKTKRNSQKNVVQNFRKLVMTFDGVIEKPHFENQAFCVNNKIFATLDEKKRVAVLHLSAIDQSVFCTIDKTIIYPVKGAWGKKGWTAFELEKVRLSVLKDALQKAYILIAKKTTIKPMY
jgi:uncharacterized protein YdhG (YjbR/CyaY superfamily)